MTCGEVRNRMDVLRAGALPESERVPMASHLEGCSTCRVLLQADVRLPGRRGYAIYSPLLLVAGLSLGATVLARCGGPTDAPGRTDGGTQVATAPGEGGQIPGGAQMTPATAAAEGPGRAYPLEGYPAQPPTSGIDPAATLPGATAGIRPGTPSDPRMLPPRGGLKEGSAPGEPAVDGPGRPKASVEQLPVDPAPPKGPSAEPTDPNAGSSHPQAPAPPSPGTSPGVVPPVTPVPGAGPDLQPTAPSSPTGPTTGTAPGGTPTAPVSPGRPDGAAKPKSGPDAPVVPADESDDSVKYRGFLNDRARSAGARAKAAQKLGEMKASDAIGDLLAVAQSDVALRLRSAAIEALAEIGDPRASSGLQSLMADVALGDLELPALVAGALRRLGSQRYLDQKGHAELADFSPLVRARGALVAGGAESLALAPPLIALLDDRSVVRAELTKIAGRSAPAGASAIETRHVAWRALTMIAGGVDHGLSAADWSGWLTRRLTEGGAPPPAVPAPDVRAGDIHGLAPELVAAMPALPRVLASRDGAVVHELIALLRAHTDYGRLASPPGDIFAPLAQGLPAFKNGAARDEFLATLYVTAFVERGVMTEAIAAGLAGAGKTGRTAYVGRLGAPGVQKLVAAVKSTTSDPAAQYGMGGALMTLLDAFRGSAPKRPFFDPSGKDDDARADDAKAFADAVDEYDRWWRGLGVPHWDRAAGRVVDGG